MGQTQSSTSTNIATQLTNIAVNVVSSTAVNCMTVSNQTQDQTIVIGDNSNISGITQSQTVSIDVSCLLNNTNTQSMSSDLATQLMQTATNANKGATLFDKSGNAMSISSIQNDLQTAFSNITADNMSTAINQGQTQSLKIGNNVTISGPGIDQSQGATVVAHALVTNSGIQNVVNKVADSVQQSSSASTTGVIPSVVEPIAKALGMSLTAAELFIPLVILGVIILVISLIVGITLWRRRRHRHYHGKGEDNIADLVEVDELQL